MYKIQLCQDSTLLNTMIYQKYIVLVTVLTDKN